MHKGCILHVSLRVLSDVTVILGMRQSINPNVLSEQTPLDMTDSYIVFNIVNLDVSMFVRKIMDTFNVYNMSRFMFDAHYTLFITKLAEMIRLIFIHMQK